MGTECLGTDSVLCVSAGGRAVVLERMLASLPDLAMAWLLYAVLVGVLTFAFFAALRSTIWHKVAS